MRYLASGLIAEGPSDDRFLPFLLDRTIEQICRTEFHDDVDFDKVNVIRGGSRPSTVQEIVSLVEQHPAQFDLVFVHRDQDGDDDRVHRVWIDPLRVEWGSERAECLIPVVPVRKTEAWILADGDALRDVLGIRSKNADLGVPPQPKRVEQIRDPKEPINRLNKRLGRPIESYYEELADAISLDVLGTVPSYQTLRTQMISALEDLGYRRRGSPRGRR